MFHLFFHCLHGISTVHIFATSNKFGVGLRMKFRPSVPRIGSMTGEYLSLPWLFFLLTLTGHISFSINSTYIYSIDLRTKSTVVNLDISFVYLPVLLEDCFCDFHKRLCFKITGWYKKILLQQYQSHGLKMVETFDSHRQLRVARRATEENHRRPQGTNFGLWYRRYYYNHGESSEVRLMICLISSTL